MTPQESEDPARFVDVFWDTENAFHAFSRWRAWLQILGTIHWIEHLAAKEIRSVYSYGKEGDSFVVNVDNEFIEVRDAVEWSSSHHDEPRSHPPATPGDRLWVHAVRVPSGNNLAERQLTADVRAFDSDGMLAEGLFLGGADQRDMLDVLVPPYRDRIVGVLLPSHASSSRKSFSSEGPYAGVAFKLGYEVGALGKRARDAAREELRVTRATGRPGADIPSGPRFLAMVRAERAAHAAAARRAATGEHRDGLTIVRPLLDTLASVDFTTASRESVTTSWGKLLGDEQWGAFYSAALKRPGALLDVGPRGLLIEALLALPFCPPLEVVAAYVVDAGTPALAQLTFEFDRARARRAAV